MEGALGLLGPVGLVEVELGGDQDGEPAAGPGGRVPVVGDRGAEVTVVEQPVRGGNPDPGRGDEGGRPAGQGWRGLEGGVLGGVGEQPEPVPEQGCGDGVDRLGAGSGVAGRDGDGEGHGHVGHRRGVGGADQPWACPCGACVDDDSPFPAAGRADRPRGECRVLVGHLLDVARWVLRSVAGR